MEVIASQGMLFLARTQSLIAGGQEMFKILEYYIKDFTLGCLIIALLAIWILAATKRIRRLVTLSFTKCP